MGKVSAVDVVISQVKKWILDNTYKSGDKLPSEAELCALCEVSRGSVREAMKVLSTIGLVTVRQGDGTYISMEDSSTESINPLQLKLQKSFYSSEELVELREILERSIGELIIERASDQEIDSLRGFNEKLRVAVAEKASLEEQADLDMDFHRRFGAISHNVLLSILYSQILDFIKADTARLYGLSVDMGPLSVDMHEHMIEACRNRDNRRLRFEIHCATGNHLGDPALAESRYHKALNDFEAD